MVTGKTVELPKPKKQKPKKRKPADEQRSGYPIERERLVAKKWSTEHVLKYKLGKF